MDMIPSHRIANLALRRLEEAKDSVSRAAYSTDDRNAAAEKIALAMEPIALIADARVSIMDAPDDDQDAKPAPFPVPTTL